MPAPEQHPFIVAKDGLRVQVRLQPGARRNEIVGLTPQDDGSIALKVRVTAAPEKGKANAAMIKLLAKSWGIPKSDLMIVAGQHDRRKTVLAQGASATLLPKMMAWLKSMPDLGRDR